VLHIYPPERPTTSFYAPESPIIINNMRKAEAFRNRQVTGSIPVVGSITSITIATPSQRGFVITDAQLPHAGIRFQFFHAAWAFTPAAKACLASGK
jgi:hypothetical protein